MNGEEAVRILVIEDDPDDALFLERAFRKARVPGFDRVLRDGQEAIAYLDGRGVYADRRAHPMPTHLLLDLKLPKISGLEVLTWVRGSSQLCALPVAVLSSSGEGSDRERARQLGIDGYFVKPSRSSELLDLVRQIARIWHLPVAVS
jgi:DNA-binding response OmpR family regulator